MWIPMHYMHQWWIQDWRKSDFHARKLRICECGLWSKYHNPIGGWSLIMLKKRTFFLNERSSFISEENYRRHHPKELIDDHDKVQSWIGQQWLLFVPAMKDFHQNLLGLHEHHWPKSSSNHNCPLYIDFLQKQTCKIIPSKIRQNETSYCYSKAQIQYDTLIWQKNCDCKSIKSKRIIYLYIKCVECDQESKVSWILMAMLQIYMEYEGHQALTLTFFFGFWVLTEKLPFRQNWKFLTKNCFDTLNVQLWKESKSWRKTPYLMTFWTKQIQF